MSGLSFKQIRTYYNLCAPDEPLKPNDPRNIDLDQIQIDNHSPRGRNWVHRLAKQVDLSRFHEPSSVEDHRLGRRGNSPHQASERAREHQPRDRQRPEAERLPAAAPQLGL